MLGVVAALGSPDGSRIFVLDHFGLPSDAAAAHELVAVASGAARAADAEEAGIFAPAGSTVDDPGLAHLVGPLRAAGWRLLVERRHYEFEPPESLGADLATDLRFEQLNDPADPRLAACHREVMRETLAEAARTRLAMVDVGGLVVRDVDAMILPDEALSENLLGLSFLSKLKRFEYASGKMVLEQ